MRLGELLVAPLVDGHAVMEPEGIFLDAPADGLRQEGLLSSGGLLEFPYGSFLVRGPAGKVVLFDLGAGPDPGFFPFAAPRHGLLPSALASHGVGEADVTDVVLSHLHADHMGWATVDGQVRFTSARHHVHAADWQHFAESDASPHIRARLAPLLPRVHLWSAPSVELFPWLTVTVAPGHTPGSAVAELESGTDRLALVGDLMHDPALIRHPDWAGASDWDAGLAIAERRAWTARCRARNTPIVGAHFPAMLPVAVDGEHGGDRV
jgi:glyoxylase-like metal-dependent hydrolase (beta-lactamase superfamily II)